MTSPRSRQPNPVDTAARDAARAQKARDDAELRAIMTAQVAQLLAGALQLAADNQEDHGAFEDYPRITAIDTLTQHGTPALTGDRPANVRLRLTGGAEVVLMVDLRDIDPHRWEPIEPAHRAADGKWLGIAQATDGYCTTAEDCGHPHDTRPDAIACSRELAVRLTVART